MSIVTFRNTAFLLLALPAMGQSPESPASEETPTFRAGVNLVQVPVTVRDRDGRAVAGLQKDDFELFDKGKRQEIASFAEVKPGEQTANKAGGGAAVIPARFTVWVIDDMAITDLVRVREAAEKQLAALQPGDRASIVTTSCRILLDFTSDQKALRETLDKLTMRPIPICRVNRTEVIQLEVLASVVRRMANTPGQRDIVLVSPGFVVGPDRLREQAALIDAAVRARVLINALDVGGGPNIAASGSTTPGYFGNPDGAPQAYAYRPPGPETLIALAHGTGGEYVFAGNDYDVAFRKLSTPESYYVLGFAPQGKTDGSVHPLRVKLKDGHKLSVQSRESYVASTPAGQ